MKKIFCFYCQKEVSPLKFWKWSFCPHCLRKTTDNGEGLYLVCDKCGANIPTDAEYCLKCGHGMNGYPDNERFSLIAENKSWLEWLRDAALFLFSVLAAAVILYLSIYFLLSILGFVLVIGFGCMIYSALRQKF